MAINISDKIKEIGKDKHLVSSIEEYKNAQTDLKWKCDKGHIFIACWNKIQQGRWCPYCAGKYLSIKDAIEVAEARGGKCLSKVYTKCKDRLLWECSSGHRWYTTLNNVRNQGNWCPYCNNSVGEKICRKYFEFLFGKKFPKARPIWLTNKDNNRLELDGYCEELNLAFEYNGPHHYENYRRDNKRVIDNDKIKKELCNLYGVNLIIIPFAKCNLKTNIKNIIISELSSIGYKIKESFNNFEIEDYELYDVNPLRDLENIAKSFGGKLLSNSYGGSDGKLLWECKLGHIWEARPNTIKNRNTWCPTCSNVHKMDKASILEKLSLIRDEEENSGKRRILSRVIIILNNKWVED